ncbi:glycosyltransferase family 2 protein [Caenimonas sp. SL110]|uniref:glycosyltransferase family 2 protein n=1 Tax=Caenimonas sp. SL110 TaxID=1450524 RepID=UPI0009E339FC|nr:galactosyltransferase-related protein [Caenimonas sp. SL110]
MTALRRARTLMGVLVKDLPVYLPALAGGAGAWLTARNRDERLDPGPDGIGYRCDWEWTRELHAPQHVPALGRALMRRALHAHPVRRAKTFTPDTSQQPQVCFVIGHRGQARLPHLLATLESIAAQDGARIECVVVEQDVQATLAPHLPDWVRLVHTPPADAGVPYCRSWSLNAGTDAARAPIVILHDNDMLVPVDYAAQVIARMAQGYHVVNLKRFVFYLDADHTRRIFEGQAALLDAAPETIVQNLEAGGSIAITRDAFERIGGMDESFIGWGGEDNEFWERAQTLRVWPWAYLPIVHLWHAAQPGKRDAQYQTALHYQKLRAVDPRERIEALRKLRQAA